MVESKQQYKAWLYLLPTIILILIFTVWPIINTFRVAFLENYNAISASTGTIYNFGIKNFVKVVQYPKYTVCLKNTLVLCFLSVPISTLLALIISVCLNSIKPLSRFFQTIFFMPYVTNSIAIGMVFAAMFKIIGMNTEFESAGIVNNFLSIFGVKRINFINQGSTHFANMFVMVIYIVWNALPFKILILLGGLQSVNKQYYEAAKIDGTSKFRVFWQITVPLLSPMISYVIITGFIGGFKEYTSIVGIFGDKLGTPGNDGCMNTMVGFIYDNIKNSQGLASASAIILFGIIFIVTMVNLYLSKKKVHY